MNPATNSLAIESTRAGVWRHAIAALLVLIAAILLLYRDTAWGMVQIWSRSETFTHGFLVVPIVLWLVWRSRDALVALTPRPSGWILAPLLIAILGWLMGDLAAVNAVTQMAFVSMLVLAIPAVLGVSVARLIAFPLAFLYFAVPIGEVFLPQLMEWTANFTVVALRFSGIPVFREGLQFVIPSGNWSVVEACSGVRYLIASLTVGTLFAYLNYQSNWRRLLFVLVSILVPIVANWLRAYMIVMLGHLSGNTIAVGVDHLIYGWVFFGIVIMLMFAIGARWAEPDLVHPSPAMSEMSATGRVKTFSIWLSAACFALLVALPLPVKWNIGRMEHPAAISLLPPDRLAADWHAVEAEAPAFKPAYQMPVAEFNTLYQGKDGKVGLFLAYYRNQTYVQKLVTSNNVLVTSGDLRWTRLGSASRDTVIDGNSIAVRTLDLRANAAVDQTRDVQLVVWQIYWINGTLTTNDYLAKVYSAVYRLMGRGDDSAAIVVYTTKRIDENPHALLESFLATNYSTINGLLEKAQPAR